MYLSKIFCGIDDVRKRDLWKSYEIHRLVYSLFAKDAPRDFLYRYDILPSGIEIVILSSVPPYHTALPNFRTKEIPEKYLEHETYSFSIRLNPYPKKIDGRKEVILKEDEILSWLLERGEQYGVEFFREAVKVRRKATISFPKEDKTSATGKRQVTLTYCDIAGILKVTDCEKFKETVRHGIGKAKGFGFGMLEISPIRF